MGKKAESALEIENLSKSFGTVLANDHICMKFYKGEISAVLGENGSGKTTLINMISGIYYPDGGNILMGGKPVVIKSPKDAYALGIGVVHQHFNLVNRMTAAANIAIGMTGGIFINNNKIRKQICEIAEKYEFQIDPDKKIYDMSVSEKQTLEIVKMLIKGADILILDEPTAVLAPQETENLFRILKAMKNDGKTVIIITHKLQEVLQVSDKVFIMRKGKLIDTVKTSMADIPILTEKMVGHSVELSLERPEVKNKVKIISVQRLVCKDRQGFAALDNVSFDIYGGEILGIAGIAGGGQKELCEALAGVAYVESGRIIYYSTEGTIEIENRNPAAREKKNIRIGFVPEDRLGMGLIASAGMADNIMLRSYKSGKGIFVNRKKPREIAGELMGRLEIAAPGIHTPVRMLSGGNIQKILLGREIRQHPAVLIVSYPVRGLDINSSYTIYALLNEEKKKGVAVVFVGEDLDVLMEISDRLLVLANHTVGGIADPRTTTKEEIGLLMTKTTNREV